jgi:hypothetical protein
MSAHQVTEVYLQRGKDNDTTMESNKMGMKCIADLHKHTCTYKKTVPHSIHAVILTDRPPIVDTDLQF